MSDWTKHVNKLATETEYQNLQPECSLVLQAKQRIPCAS